MEICGRPDRRAPAVVFWAAATADRRLVQEASRPPESGGQRDRDVVEIAREEVPQPHSEKGRLLEPPLARPFGSRCPPDSGGRGASESSTLIWTVPGFTQKRHSH